MLEFLAAYWFSLCVLIVITPLVTIFSWWYVRALYLSFCAWKYDIHLGIFDIILMQLRQINTALLINQLVVLKHAQLAVDMDVLVAHHLAGGNIRQVVAAMVAAKRHGIPLNVERATAVDLIGQDPLQLIADAVHEATKISPHQASDSPFMPSAVPARAPINPASALLQVRPGSLGNVALEPRLIARVRFPNGELDVVINRKRVPNAGEQMRVISVDGITVAAEPVAAA